MAEKDEKEKLVVEACKAYEIPAKYLFASSVDDAGTVTLLTHGGKRVRWSKGMEAVVPLTQIEITGINPELAKRKPITGKKRA